MNCHRYVLPIWFKIFYKFRQGTWTNVLSYFSILTLFQLTSLVRVLLISNLFLLTGGKCENISTTFNHLQYQEKCIIFLDDSPRDQSSATTKCKDDFNGTLVEIRNEKLQKIIENFIDTNMSVIANWWIGLVEELNERTWEWVDGKKIINTGITHRCVTLYGMNIITHIGRLVYGRPKTRSF